MTLGHDLSTINTVLVLLLLLLCTANYKAGCYIC